MAARRVVGHLPQHALDLDALQPPALVDLQERVQALQRGARLVVDLARRPSIERSGYPQTRVGRLELLPFPEQLLDTCFVEFGPAFRQPAAQVDARQHGKQQWRARHLAQIGANGQRRSQPLARGLGLARSALRACLDIQALSAAHRLLMPTVEEVFDARVVQGFQGGRGQRLQAAVALLIGLDPAGNQNGRLGIGRAEGLHALHEDPPPIEAGGIVRVGRRRLVQAVEEQQRVGPLQPQFQARCGLAQGGAQRVQDQCRTGVAPTR